ncbi:MarR family winged helix-turn-helix transcriptional regulator [Actinocorallia populi]|uniref:MarR family winged helix-turn-helix transcriptional regulator n=1 Tax=Actinocorallia populi TaxID=2079200 RepID=UPI000D088137|nr:MarR family transcriptional regulator [Actinocorallia populi]
MKYELEHLSEEEGRAWRAHLQLHARLGARLTRSLMSDSGLSGADYGVLVTLAGAPEGRMTSLAVRCALLWEKSRLSHQVRRMEQRGLITREANPDDARSSLLCLTPQGRAVIEATVPPHAQRLREHFLDLMTPEERAVLTAVNERVLAHLDQEDEADPPCEEAC